MEAMGALLALPGWTAFAIVASYIIVRCHESDKPGFWTYLLLAASVLVALGMCLTIIYSATLSSLWIVAVSIIFGPLAVVNLMAFRTRNIKIDKQNNKDGDDEEELYDRRGRVACCTILFLITGLIMTVCAQGFLPAKLKDL